MEEPTFSLDKTDEPARSWINDESPSDKALLFRFPLDLKNGAKSLIARGEYKYRAAMKFL